MVMHQNNIDKKIHYFLGGAILLISTLVYALTTSKTTAFWDAGEFIPAILELGVPHPPGNPFYVLFGKFFTLFGLWVSPAYMANLYSSVLAGFAVLFTYLFSVKFARMVYKDITDSWYIYGVGVFASLLVAFSNSFWINAIEAEVYAGNSFFINLIVWLTMVWAEKSEDLDNQNTLIFIFFLFFLGFSFHQTALQIVPAVMFVALFSQIRPHLNNSSFWIKSSLYFVGFLAIFGILTPIGNSFGYPSLSKFVFLGISVFVLHHYLKKKVSTRVWLLTILFIFLGFSVHLLLIFRANNQPYINESNPYNFQNFMDFLLRKQYGGSNFLRRNSPFTYQMNFHFYRYFTQQFFYPDFFAKLLSIPVKTASLLSNTLLFSLGILGMVFHYRGRKTSFIWFASFFLISSLGMIFVMNLSDHEVRNRMYFFVAAYNFWAVWMGFGLVAIARYFEGFAKSIGRAVLVLLLLFPTINYLSFYEIHDRSKNYTPIEYAMGFLNSVEANAILFTNGDNDTFPLWYAQSVFDPYAKEFTPESSGQVEPDELTKTRLEETREQKATQRKGIRGDVAIVNLSLINTPWYIRQLRDKDGVIFGWSDQEIDRLTPIALDSDRFFKFYDKYGKLVMSLKMEKGRVLYVRDFAILQIVKNNFGKRPIYFASTTPENYLFSDYWKSEGFVYRLVADKNDDFNLKRTIENLENVVVTKSYEDESVYKDGDMSRMSNFISTAFYKLHFICIQYLNDFTLAKKYLKRAQTLATGEHQKQYTAQLNQLEEYIRQQSK